MKNYPVLGGMTPQRFLRDHWQKKPVLIRQAIPGFTPPLSPDRLRKLAANPQVESRLINSEGEWTFDTGPFKRLPGRSRKNWTLLVQGANLHNDAAALLLERFRFVPDARLDDLMISYAGDGGGVGPHFDSYDVFLLQAHGQRRWRISMQQDLALVEGIPLKILKNFQPEQEFVLEPGDMLYLPPHTAHEGVAIGECMTCSIGFRAPAYQELGEAFLQFMTETLDLPGLYADPDLRSSARPAQIDSGMVKRISAELRKIQFTDNDVAIFLGEYLTQPKRGVVFDAPARPLGRARFLSTACERGVRLARQTRLLYRTRHIFINGESLIAPTADRSTLAALADERRLDGPAVAVTSSDAQEALHLWYEDGWLLLD
jgi:50S ribosomal protein L16 3-hydroxylase